jgi:hypothetical protein
VTPRFAFLKKWELHKATTDFCNHEPFPATKRSVAPGIPVDEQCGNNPNVIRWFPSAPGSAFEFENCTGDWPPQDGHGSDSDATPCAAHKFSLVKDDFCLKLPGKLVGTVRIAIRTVTLFFNLRRQPA